MPKRGLKPILESDFDLKLVRDALYGTDVGDADSAVVDITEESGSGDYTAVKHALDDVMFKAEAPDVRYAATGGDAADFQRGLLTLGLGEKVKLQALSPSFGAQARLIELAHPMDTAIRQAVQFGDFFTRLTDGFFSLLVPEERKNFWQRVKPENIPDPRTGLTGHEELLLNLKARRAGLIPKFERMPVTRRQTGLPPLRFSEVVARLTGGKEGREAYNTVRPLLPAREQTMLAGIDLLGDVFASPDVLIGGPLIKGVSAGQKALRIAGVKKLAETARVIPGLSTPAEIEAAFKAKSALRIHAVRELTRPSVQATEAIRMQLTGTPKQYAASLKSGEMISDGRVLALDFLQGVQPISDAQGVFAKLNPHISQKIADIYDDLIDLDRLAMRRGITKQLVSRGFTEEGAKQTRGLLKRIETQYGPLTRQLVEKDILALGPKSKFIRPGYRTPLTGFQARYLSPLARFVQNPEFAVPELYGIALRGQLRFDQEYHATMDALKGALQQIPKHSKSDERIFDALNAVKYYDARTGKYKLSADRVKKYNALDAEEKRAFTVVEKFFDTAALDLQKRALLALPGMRPKGTQLATVLGYAPHVFGKGILKRIPPELVHLRFNRNPMFAHLMPRRGAEGYIKSVHEAVESYVPGYLRKTIIEPSAKYMRKAAGKYLNPIDAWYAKHFINEFVGDPGIGARWINTTLRAMEQQTGLKFTSATRSATKLTALWYYGMLGGNMAFMTKNLLQLANTAARTSPVHVLKGLAWYGTKEGRKITDKLNLPFRFKQVGDLGVNFKLGKFTLDEYLSNTAAFSESFNRGVSFWAGVSDYVARNKIGKLGDLLNGDPRRVVAAFNQGLRVSNETQFIYGSAGRNPFIPQILGGPLGKLGGQFQSFFLKQTEFVLRDLHDDYGIALKWLLYSGVASRAMSNEFKVDATSFTGVGQLLPPIRRDQPLLASPAVGLMYNFLKLVSGESDEEKEEAADNIKEIGANVFPMHLAASRFIKAYYPPGTNEIDIALGRVKPGQGTMQTGELRSKEGVLLQSGLTQQERVMSLIGLPLQSSAERRRIEDRFGRFNRTQAQVTEDLRPQLIAAYAGNDSLKMSQVWQKMSQAWGFNLPMPEDPMEAVLEAQQLEAFYRKLIRDMPAAEASGAVSEYLKFQKTRGQPVGGQ